MHITRNYVGTGKELTADCNACPLQEGEYCPWLERLGSSRLAQ